MGQNTPRVIHARRQRSDHREWEEEVGGETRLSTLTSANEIGILDMTFNAKIANRILRSVRGRAERLDSEQIAGTFVDVGPLMEILHTEDHQVMFGRRGTGKTHALRYLSDKVTENNDLSIFIDMTRLGSDISIYNDGELSVQERGTRLLIDVLHSIHDGFLDIATGAYSPADLNSFIELLEAFGDSISDVRIIGTVEVESKNKTVGQEIKDHTWSLSSTTTSLIGSLSVKKGAQTSREESSEKTTSGRETYNIRFARIGATLGDICRFLRRKRVWLLIDEWSSLPESLQPFLADLLRRTLFNQNNISVKIAAVEHRSRFIIEQYKGDYIGMEPTADIRMNLSLDNYLLFENDPERSVDFFSHFIYRHALVIAREKGLAEPPSPESIITIAFTQKSVFAEFVKATEGVPRDAMYIISHAAQKAGESAISMPQIRQAAYEYYTGEKMSQIDTNPKLSQLLQFIINDAIKKKKQTHSFWKSVFEIKISMHYLTDA